MEPNRKFIVGVLGWVTILQLGHAQADEGCLLDFSRALPAETTWCESRCGIELSVEVNSDTPPFYQWQLRLPGQVVYADLSGETNSTYTTPPILPNIDGTVFRVVVTNDCGSMIQSSVSLTLCGDIRVFEPHFVSAYSTNRILVRFNDAAVPGTAANFSIIPSRVISDVITNDFDQTVMEVILDDTTPLETGEEYVLRISGISSLPPLNHSLSTEPYDIRIRPDAREPLTSAGPLHLVDQAWATHGQTWDAWEGFVHVHHLVWFGDEMLQYADELEGPWIDLPDARKGHPMRQRFYDCEPHVLPGQRFFRLIPRE